MGLVAVKDPALLAELDAGVPAGLKPVTDEKLLLELDGSGRSIGGEALRQVGLTARAGAEGLAGLADIVAAPVAGVYNTVADLFKPAPTLSGQVTGEPKGFRFKEQPTVQGVRSVLSMLGVPEPGNSTERVVGDIAGAMTGQGAIVRGAQFGSGKVAELLASRPALQTISAAGGAAGAGMAREGGVGPLGQAVAGVGGAILPSMVAAGAPMTVRAMLRGGEEGRQKLAGNIKLFEEAGYGTPTVGQGTERRLPRAIESGLSKTPGGAGRVVSAGETGAENLGERVTGLADDLSKGASATKAGGVIDKGVKGFVERFRGEQKTLYDKLDTHIPKDSQVDMTNTVNVLSTLNADIPGAPALSKFFKNSTIQSIEGAMKSDTEGFTTRLPYEALKKLRTMVGQEMENTSLTSSVPRSKWKALYGALSDDLGEAAAASGHEAQKAWARANQYTRAGHDRIGTFLDRVAGKDTMERIFTAAVNPSEVREGASTVNAVMRSLEPEARDTVRAAFLKRLGVAQAGKQDAVGEVFSPETFLTNWNKISPEAKMTLFADSKGTLRDDLNKIAKVAANLREGSKVFSNPSGTQQAVSSQMAGGGIFVALATGHPGVAAAIGGTALTANAASRLMTNPEFVKWLAKSTQSPAAAIASLQSVAQSMDSDDRNATEEFIEKAKRLQQQQSGSRQK